MKSFGIVLEESKGLGRGFDFMRIALSLAVVTRHVISLAGPAGAGANPGAETGFGSGLDWIVSYSILIMFFGLSGFLISGSAMRLTLKNFLINRGLRIFPALAVEVMLSALVLGPIFTTLTLSEYFTDHKLFLYFTNLLGFVYYFLPGVFNGDWVNGSIWTVPYEMGCYAIISVLIFYQLLRKRWLIVGISVMIGLVEIVLALLNFRGQQLTMHSIPELIRLAPQYIVYYIFYARGSRLLISFTVGIAFYLFRHQIPYSKILFFAAIATVIVAESIGGWTSEESPISNVFIVVPVIYITIFLGLTNIPLISILRKGDYSYGIYLYGWPLTQATRMVFPEQTKSWPFLLAASLVPILLFAAFSWHLIERPILQMRKKFSFVARQRLAEVDTASTVVGQQSATTQNASPPL